MYAHHSKITPMKLGIDFGTTRTSIAVVDRGNYPALYFHDNNGDTHEYVPSVVAYSNNTVMYGFDAEDAALNGAPHIRSFKRLLADAARNCHTHITIGSTTLTLHELLTGFFAYLSHLVRTQSTFAPLSHDEPLEAVIGVPAHAHSAQRFLTLEAAKNGGFTPMLLLNEPSAAGLEYAHRHASTINSKRTRVLVYDLGGGTFDASLVSVDGTSHEVLASHGHNHLGGDDFDHSLAVALLDSASIDPESLTSEQLATTVNEARLAKEALIPQSRWISIPSPINDETLTISVAVFYSAIADLVNTTLDTMLPLLKVDADQSLALHDDVAGIYIVGGATELPIISRVLRQHFARRVHRSPHSSVSTAIGLAIAADPEAPYKLTERLARGLGVFREMDGGRMVSFDALLPHDMLLRTDKDGLTSITRTYKAAHNLGVFRFAEFSALDSDGIPRGDVAPLAEFFFPFDSALETLDETHLSRLEVHRCETGAMIQEKYTVDPHGIVWVTLTNLDSGYSRTHSLALSAHQ